MAFVAPALKLVGKTNAKTVASTSLSTMSAMAQILAGEQAQAA